MTDLAIVLPEPFSAAVFQPGDASAQLLRLQVERIAPHFRIALLTGEPGTGKLTVAYAMHCAGPVAAGSFTICDAASFAGLDLGESDHRSPGTLYLTNLERVPIEAQPALLERLNATSRHLRVIVSTEQDLRGLVASGRLLEALHERVGSLAIRLVPLRERRESIGLIATSMLEAIALRRRFTDAALACLREHFWKNNLAELRQVVEQSARESLEEEIGPELIHLQAIEAAAAPAVRLEEVIERHVVDVVQRCAGNKLRAAELLGISRSTLYRMLEAATHN